MGMTKSKKSSILVYFQMSTRFSPPPLARAKAATEKAAAPEPKKTPIPPYKVPIKPRILVLKVKKDSLVSLGKNANVIDNTASLKH